MNQKIKINNSGSKLSRQSIEGSNNPNVALPASYIKGSETGGEGEIRRILRTKISDHYLINKLARVACKIKESDRFKNLSPRLCVEKALDAHHADNRVFIC